MSSYAYNEMWKLLIVLFIFSYMPQMNSFAIKRFGNSNPIHEETIQKPRHYVEPSEYMNKMRSINDKLYTRKVKRDQYTGLIKVSNTEDPFDFVFPQDDIYGYQPEVINYDVEYITTDDNLVKTQIKTSFGDHSNVMAKKLNNYSTDGTKEKPRDTVETIFGSKWTKTITETTTQLIDESLSNTVNPAETNSSTAKFLTILDSSNGYGVHSITNQVGDVDNNAIKVNTIINDKTNKSSDISSLSWSRFCEIQCFKNVVNHYDPVCGSDGNSYWNYQKLSCVNKCGKNVTKSYNAKCTNRDARLVW